MAAEGMKTQSVRLPAWFVELARAYAKEHRISIQQAVVVMTMGERR